MLGKKGRTERAQAYTLEGFIGAMVLLLAVLFALQAVVITPTTGGLADRTVQAQLQQEAQDALTVASQDGNLSETIRNWNESTGEFHGASSPASGQNESAYNATEFGNQSTLGAILHERYTDDGWSYNVELVYEDGDEFDSTYMVYQGSPPSGAFTASHTVTLYEDDLLVRPNESGVKPTLPETSEYPIPDASSGDSGVYNLVEVRVIIW